MLSILPSVKKTTSFLFNPLGRFILFYFSLELYSLYLPDPLHIKYEKEISLLSPNFNFWMGTSPLGHNIFPYFILSLRNAIRFSLLSLSISLFLGLLIGIYSSYKGKLVNFSLRRLMDTVGVLPFFYTLLIIARFWNMSWYNLALVFSLLGGWLVFAYQAREHSESIKDKDYIMALKSQGARDSYIIFRVIFPYSFNLLRPLIALNFNYLLLSLTTLDFLGINSRSFENPSLGQLMIWSVKDPQAWWLWLPSLLVIAWLTLEISDINRNPREGKKGKLYEKDIENK